MLKKWFCSIFLSIMLVITGKEVLASGFDDSDLLHSQDYREVLTLEPQIMNIKYSTYNGQDSSSAEKTIAFDKAIKVYTLTNVFESGDITADELCAILHQANYEWKVPVYYCGESAVVSIGKTQTGNMGIGIIQMIDKPMEYQEEIIQLMNEKNIPLEESEIYFVEHSLGYDGLMAIIVHGEDKYVIPFHREVWISNSEARGVDRIEAETLFDFDTMVSIVSENEEESEKAAVLEGNSDGTGIFSESDVDSNNSWRIYLAIGVVCCVVLGVAISKKVKKNERK